MASPIENFKQFLSRSSLAAPPPSNSTQQPPPRPSPIQNIQQAQFRSKLEAPPPPLHPQQPPPLSSPTKNFQQSPFTSNVAPPPPSLTQQPPPHSLPVDNFQQALSQSNLAPPPQPQPQQPPPRSSIESFQQAPFRLNLAAPTQQPPPRSSPIKNWQQTLPRSKPAAPPRPLPQQPPPTSSQIQNFQQALLRSMLSTHPPVPPPQQPPRLSSPEKSNNKWKLKAKMRKQELLRLREDLKLAEENSSCDLFPKYAACKCYFFDGLGELPRHSQTSDGSDWRFNDVLLRRFLRQVRLYERRRRKDGTRKEHKLYDYNSEDENEQLGCSVDFLVELCNSATPEKTEEAQFSNWSHQAVDFILGALKHRISKGENMKLLEGIVSNLIVRLVKKMCTFSGGDDVSHLNTEGPLCIQHLIRKLGIESFVGQRVILAVSQRITIIGESLIFMDPFNGAFPSMHDSLYIMIQLVEFLLSDYLVNWSSSEGFDIRLFEEWVKSIIHARKALQLLETRNGLYVMYMDRVVGHVAKYVGQIPSLRKLNSDVLSSLFS